MNRPQALLLDEPLGALDLKLRQELQVELKDIQQELGITFVYVTHDQEEALTMSDRLAVFNDGRIEQIGAPAEVYEHPGQRVHRRLRRRLERARAAAAASPCGPRRSGCSATGSTPSRASTWSRSIHDVVYVGAITRYHLELDAGGKLTVVSQNSGSEELQQQGSRVRCVGGRSRSSNLEGGRRRSDEKVRNGRWAAMLFGTARAVRTGRRVR